MVRAQNTTGSPAQLVREIAEDSGTLIRKEIELAKHELMATVTAKAKEAAIFGVAGVFALVGLVFGAHAIVAALDLAWPEWLAYLVVTIGLLTVAGFAVMAARAAGTRRAKDLLPQTTKTIKEDIGWARTQLKR
jgi:hypothetical protein